MAQVDRFQIEELVARGGMASVFKAKDLHTGETVALKIPHPEVEADVVFYDRFRREAEIGREIDHPGVARVVDSGQKGRLFIAMEWVEGRSLRSVLDAEGKLDKDRAFRIALGVCDALEYLHSKGVVHRDLKPENIMLSASDEVKLLDFGVAAKKGARRLTFGKWSRIMGTADYISPEQVKGKRGDNRSDIYALGVIMFEMLTGGVLFEADSPMLALNMKLRNPAPRAPGVSALIYKALARDPKDRYASAADLAAAIENPKEEQPVVTAFKEERVLIYSLIAMIPGVLFVLLFYVANLP
jgi:serine/threonine-protein kinase